MCNYNSQKPHSQITPKFSVQVLHVAVAWFFCDGNAISYELLYDTITYDTGD